VAFVSVEFRLSERTACKLLGVERSSYRYEPRPDRNIALREELVKLARQKPRYGYRRLHALLERRGLEVNVKRVYRLYAEEGLAVRRRKRKRLVRDRALEPRLIRPNPGVGDGLHHRRPGNWEDGSHLECRRCLHA
jgi:putative transposase